MTCDDDDKGDNDDSDDGDDDDELNNAIGLDANVVHDKTNFSCKNKGEYKIDNNSVITITKRSGTVYLLNNQPAIQVYNINGNTTCSFHPCRFP
jgi:hypothetical protein